ncbi:nat10 protein [Trypanosoma rangeli]|uniref:RNA cytidine acetyltransferase n=1 Tax=Trypanosoma rangeli TaxID=5698 RepID=A0A422NAR4_TRYRA|nr:nat10 protein [Trypanosoma rangeli]RNF02567.1 nat10 protein [Trypanosoma rangeli]|eukprot:RNF02567.1 nat10 protein [Trypanosoma rangeli]
MPSSASVASTARSNAVRGVTIKRKVDDRVRHLIDNAVHKKHRALLLLVGDRGKDQIVNLHQMVSHANHSAKVNMLWCMKKEPDFGSTSSKKQEKRARLEVKGGMSTEATKEAFQTFLAQTSIRFCQYKETHKILGQTFGMAVLQDFEAITPNTLARTVETVKGGGLVVIMFRAMRSLKQLYTIAMDVHARYRTEALRDVVPRFNERFLLSLVDCDTALCVDDDLNVLPITAKMQSVENARTSSYDAELALQGRQKHEADLLALKDRLRGSSEVGPLVAVCQTLEQGKTVLSLMQTVVEKSLNTTCVVTAGRGRGKSAALGLAAAGALAQGYSNIFCTAPSPENLQSFFEFVVRGLKELGYTERTEFEAMQSTNVEFSKCIVRINLFREHRQTVQYISPHDASKFAQAELAIIDEAAALPLPVVKQMLGPYLVFLSSTVSGYEGTGRSLSMKLVADMRKHCGSDSGTGATTAAAGNSDDRRFLREIALTDPIRYGPNDPVESWLNKLLCLDATVRPVGVKTCPHPSKCELYYVNRDALFSYHPLAEQLLQTIVAMLVAAHYKNQPNDLQLMSDAPGHHVFLLCSATVDAKDGLPDVFCVIHACEEGQVTSEAIKNNLSRGVRPAGDLIPYTLSQCYLEEGFAKLAGLRIVRIATNPELQRSGYGSRALALLQQYYSGSISLSAAPVPSSLAQEGNGEEGADDDANSSIIQPRKRIPTLLTPLLERPYEMIDYLGVSFGVTTALFNFWRRAGYEPLYLRHAANELTGEHSCVMVRPIGLDLALLRAEFRRRFIPLLAMPFRHLPTELALSILKDIDVNDPQKLAAVTDLSRAAEHIVRVGGQVQCTWTELDRIFSSNDMKRLKLNATTFVEGGQVLDLLPALAKVYFESRLHRLPDGSEGVVLSHAQAAVLLAVGLQCQTLEQVAQQTVFAGVPIQQLRAFLQKAVSRIVEHFTRLQKLKVPGTDGTKPNETEVSEENEEDVREIYDNAGQLVGLSVEKKVRRSINVDSTLLRDAKSLIQGTRGEAGSATGLQRTFKRSKKTRLS